MNFTQKLILASNSPRRQELLTRLGLPFEVRIKEVEETYPGNLQRYEVAEYLAAKKADAYLSDLKDQEVILTADTIVCLEDRVLNKPTATAEAQEMLRALSGRDHDVITGVCLMSNKKKVVLHDVTRVFFKPLTEEEINWYINHYKPFDKAGAYGAQDWIGMVAIQKLEGSFYNVMGLPMHALYAALLAF